MVESDRQSRTNLEPEEQWAGEDADDLLRAGDCAQRLAVVCGAGDCADGSADTGVMTARETDDALSEMLVHNFNSGKERWTAEDICAIAYYWGWGGSRPNSR